MLDIEQREECERLEKIFEPYKIYDKDEIWDGMKKMPPVAQKAYNAWARIAEPVDENGDRIMV